MVASREYFVLAVKCLLMYMPIDLYPAEFHQLQTVSSHVKITILIKKPGAK